MDFIDYYKILGLDKNAKPEEIKSTYRKLARKFHPDLNPNDKEANKKFQQINEANEVLSDPEKRKKYDQYGKDWQHADAFEKAQQAGGGRRTRRGEGASAGRGGAGYETNGGFGESGGFGSGGSSFGGAEFGEGGEFSDFFESLFGGSGAAGGAARGGGKSRFRGQDLHAEYQLSLEAAYTTHQQVLSVNDKNIRITIPAGVENGQVIKLKGHGSPGTNGGPAGDLYITFSIAENPQFRRDGNDLYTKLPVDIYTAILGGEVTADTLNGKVKLKLKPETQNGATMRLKEKGFPVYKSEGKFGDLYVSLEIRMPVNLTEKEKQLFRELEALAKKDPK